MRVSVRQSVKLSGRGRQRHSQRWDDRPPRKSVRDLLQESGDDDADSPDEVFPMSDRLRCSSVPGLEGVRNNSELRSFPMSRNMSNMSKQLSTYNSILDEIKDGQHRLSMQLSQEAGELKVQMQMLSVDLAKLRRSDNTMVSEPKSPSIAPSALRAKGSIPADRSELLARRNKISVSSLNLTGTDRASLTGAKKWSLFGDTALHVSGDSSNPLLGDTSSLHVGVSEDFVAVGMEDQDVPDVPSLVMPTTEVQAQHVHLRPNFHTVNAALQEKVRMNGISDLSHIGKCGHDDPIVCSSSDFKAFNGTAGEGRRLSFTSDTKVCDGIGSVVGSVVESSVGTSPGHSPRIITTMSAAHSSMTQASTRSMTQGGTGRSHIACNFSSARPRIHSLPTRGSEAKMDLQPDTRTGSVVFSRRHSNITRYIMFPDSPRRNFWDICSFFVLIFDCITIPYNIAWSPPADSLSVVIASWTTMIFWSIDMLLSFNTAYYVGGDLETRRSLIVKNYLKTYFAFDAVATGCDWIMAMLQLMPEGLGNGDTNFASLFRFVKAQRALRVARFLRVSSMWSRLEQMHLMFLSDAWQLLTQVITMLFGLFLVNHFVCCFWYAIGKQAAKDTGLTWLDTSENVDGLSKTYHDYSEVYQYVTSYHWSVVQMFVGSIQINAMNTSERIYNIFCNLFGTFFTAGITSWFSAILVRYQSQHNEFELVMKSVRRYLRYNKVDPSLSARVQKQLAIRLSVRKRDTEADIDAFKLLSKVLRAEVRLDVSHEVFFASPMIMLLDCFDHNIVLNLALHFEYVELIPGEELFDSMSSLNKAYGIIRGCLIYTFHGKEDQDLSSKELEPVEHGISGSTIQNVNHLLGTVCEAGEWIAEAALWVGEWQTRGLMECHVESELLSLDREAFQSVCGRYPKIQALMAAYAKSYEDLLRNRDECDMTDIAPPVDHPVVIMNMHTTDRVVAAEPVLFQLRSRDVGIFSFQGAFQIRPKKGANVLEKEVKSGECGLILDKSGNASRIAFVVLLRAERSDGLVLIQVAKYEDGNTKSKLQMPATKMKDGERVTEAAQRILKKNLGQFGGAQSMGKHTQDVLVKPTEGYGMETCFYSTQILVPFEKSSISPPGIRCQLDQLEIAHRSTGLKSTAFSGRMKPTLSQASSSRLEYSSFTEMMPDEVYFVRSGPNSGTIFAWMTDAAFAFLSEISNEHTLDEYVAHFDIPDDLDELCS